ncbi:ABC transporter permease [Paenibacillus senegalensis]|uniref:ABC transporter permease n=1 Tax=Paenibacillus senegalensis TaxID=1465766 RepID=UPI000287A4F3|nr:ABC transporter permease [Paenibacillus senegalensis]
MARMIYFSILRMLRGYSAIILLFVVPLAIITLLSLIVGNEYSVEGLSSRQYIAMTMVIVFQLFSGNYAMFYIHADLVKLRRWKIQSLPVSLFKYSAAILFASTFFSTLQGLLLVLYTRLLFGVEWGNYAWLLLIIVTLSLLSQFVHLTMVFSTSTISMAERFTEIYGIGFILLAGIIFPMPVWPVIEWINGFLNPITLAQSALMGPVAQIDYGNPYASLLLLIVQLLLFAVLSAVLGRRRLS